MNVDYMECKDHGLSSDQRPPGVNLKTLLQERGPLFTDDDEEDAQLVYSYGFDEDNDHCHPVDHVPMQSYPCVCACGECACGQNSTQAPDDSDDEDNPMSLLPPFCSNPQNLVSDIFSTP